MSAMDYLALLDASARMVRPDKTGYTPSEVPPIFARLKLDPDYWKLQIQDFGRLFANVAGKPKDVYEMRSLISKRRFYLKRLKPEPVQANYPLANLFVSMLQRMGLETDRFATSTGTMRGLEMG